MATNGNDGSPGTAAQPFLTIQHGINAAADGDTVSIAGGTYSGGGNYALNIAKSVTLVGPGAPSACVISANGFGPCVLSLAATNCVFQGIRFQNGRVSNPGNVFAGGITQLSALATYRNCEFMGCFSSGSNSRGGAMWVDFNCRAVFSDCTFTSNSAAEGGGAVRVGGEADFTRCTFTSNALYAVYTQGGGIKADNCLFQSNQSGAIYHNGTASTVTQCTFSGNSGPAITIDSFQTPMAFTNSILWGDTNGEVADTYDSATFSNCDIQQATGVHEGAANINADPRFVSATDLHLQSTSPCINAGVKGAGSSTTDISGQTPRTVGPAPDMGAYEFLPAGTLFVDKATGNDANAGTVTAPLQTVTKALALAVPNAGIFIRAGNYSGDKPLITKHVHLSPWDTAGAARIGAQ